MSDKLNIGEAPEEVKRYVSDPDGYFDAEEYFSIADYYESILDLENAFKVLKQGVVTYPSDVQMRLEFARMHIVSGSFDKAAKLLKALLKDPVLKEPEDRLSAHIMLSRVHAEQCNHNKINEDIRSIKLWVKDVDYDTAINAITEIATNQFQCFLYTSAIKTLQAGLKLYPKSSTLYESLIECHVKNDMGFDDAIKVCEEALDYDAYNVELWNKLGYLYKYNDNMEEAIRSFDYATSIDDNNIEAWRAMGDCHLKNDNYERAAACYIKAMGDDCTDVSLLIRIGDMFNNCDKFAEARKYYKAALDVDEDNPDALFGIGMGFFLDVDNDYGNFETAIFWIKRALTENDNNSFYWSVLADCYFNTDNWEHCIHCYHRSLSLSPHQSSLMAKLGQAYAAIGKFDDALDFLMRAKREGASLKSTDITIAATYYAMEDAANARYYLMQAMQQDNSMGEVFLDFHPDATEFVNSIRKLL